MHLNYLMQGRRVERVSLGKWRNYPTPVTRIGRTGSKVEPSYTYADVPIANIFLWEDNPRHQHLDGETAIIAKLCATEEILTLASDIVKNGINPLERIAVVPIDQDDASDIYTVAEGNRRLCALKLLTDPDRAPPNQKTRFAKLAAEWTPVSDVAAVIFEDHEATRIWLERTHSGLQGGAGRKTWDADQKQRFTGGSKNFAALHLLDYAQQLGLLNESERRRRLTTVQRFLDSEKFKNALGLRSKDDDVLRDRPLDDFNALLRAFIHDLIGGKLVNSRMKREGVDLYAEGLAARFPDATKRIDPQAMSGADPAAPTPPPAPPAPKPPKPAPPARPKTIVHVEAIAQALAAANHQKLSSLYHSLTTIDVNKHTPFLTIGAWSLFEILCKSSGAGDGQAFDAFLSKERLKTLTGETNVKAHLQAIKRIADLGNTTKHDPVAGSFNPATLVNDMEKLAPAVLALAEQLPH